MSTTRQLQTDQDTFDIYAAIFIQYLYEAEVSLQGAIGADEYQRLPSFCQASLERALSEIRSVLNSTR